MKTLQTAALAIVLAVAIGYGAGATAGDCSGPPEQSGVVLRVGDTVLPLGIAAAGTVDDAVGGTAVRVELCAPSASAVSELTATSVGMKMALVRDGKVLAEPIIREQIAGGTVLLSGTFTVEEAKAIAAEIDPGD